MARGATKKGRSRAAAVAAISTTRPLLKGHDHGEPISVRARDIGATGERWVEPFLAANAAGLSRLVLRQEVRADPEVRVLLRPGPRIGAVPLLSPSTRKVAAGLLIEPRFRWAALGAVFDAIGFSVEPGLGGGPLVPGSAREVPPWLLAAPVIERIAALLRHQRRGFVERRETRASPRGRVDWSQWATAHLPRGAWSTFPCHFSEPDDDPDLLSSVRWTLLRLEEELSTVAWSLPGRHLLGRAAELRAEVGPGAARRPPPFWTLPGASGWTAAAIEAMTWVAEERGLGGARTLDGLAWDLSIDAVWEGWVAAFGGALGRQMGLVPSPFQTARRPLRWSGPHPSMGALVPDVELRGRDRIIWLDAKYKAHLALLARRGWQGLAEDIRDQHRADLHQALAYASLADVTQVDSILVYPHLGDETRLSATVATVTSGRRRVRLVLASLPFGYRNPEHAEESMRAFREVLAA
jgi:hypothetical protein